MSGELSRVLTDLQSQSKQIQPRLQQALESGAVVRTLLDESTRRAQETAQRIAGGSSQLEARLAHLRDSLRSRRESLVQRWADATSELEKTRERSIQDQTLLDQERSAFEKSAAAAQERLRSVAGALEHCGHEHQTAVERGLAAAREALERLQKAHQNTLAELAELDAAADRCAEEVDNALQKVQAGLVHAQAAVTAASDRFAQAAGAAEPDTSAGMTILQPIIQDGVDAYGKAVDTLRSGTREALSSAREALVQHDHQVSDAGKVLSSAFRAHKQHTATRLPKTEQALAAEADRLRLALKALGQP